MALPLALYVGLRYTRAKRRNHFISAISLVSILGLAVGVMVLITVISVMNGFQKEIRDTILGATSHVTISGIDGRLTDWQSLVEQSLQYDHVEGAAPYVRGEGMISSGGKVNGTIVRGILPDREGAVSDFGNKMLEGTFDSLVPGKFNIILGFDLARAVHARVGDKITLITPQATVSPVGVLPRLKRFTVSGIFRIGNYQYDNALALTHIDDAAKLFRLPGQVNGIRLKLDDMDSAPAVSKDLLNGLSDVYFVSDWTKSNVNYFKAVETEKSVMRIILFLIVAIAAFNIVSTLVMLVTDKEADIAILRTLGASPGNIMRIFIVQGTIIGTIGIILGTIVGILLATNVGVIVPAIEGFVGRELFSSEIYYLSGVPSEFRWDDLITIVTWSFILTVLATLYPAWRASRLQPAEALQYE
ncbi:MAG: lipoprotein-releasing system transmembrane subunit LolC [Gammaproteobacteria bacterium]|nr:MAG: lipoprotein-releasing system transmembrane subunit LolC [Gammaproteobacteria bacterium]